MKEALSLGIAFGESLCGFIFFFVVNAFIAFIFGLYYALQQLFLWFMGGLLESNPPAKKPLHIASPTPADRVRMLGPFVAAFLVALSLLGIIPKSVWSRLLPIAGWCVLFYALMGFLFIAGIFDWLKEQPWYIWYDEGEDYL